MVAPLSYLEKSDSLSIEAINLGEGFAGPVLGREQHLLLGDGPFDSHLGVVVDERCLRLRRIDIVDLIHKGRRGTQHQETVGKTAGNKELTGILVRELHCHIFAEGGR